MFQTFEISVCFYFEKLQTSRQVQNNKVSGEVGSGATRLMLVLPAVGLPVLGRPVCFITIFLQFLGIKNLQFSMLLANSDLC